MYGGHNLQPPLKCVLEGDEHHGMLFMLNGDQYHKLHIMFLALTPSLPSPTKTGEGCYKGRPPDTQDGML